MSFLIPAATVLPLVAAERGDYVDKRLYVLEGKPGLYRRIARTGTGVTVKGPNAVLAMLSRNGEDQLAEFIRFDELDGELVAAGYTLPGAIKDDTDATETV